MIRNIRAAAFLTLLAILAAGPAMAEPETETVKKPVPWQLSVTGNVGSWKSRDLDNSGVQSQIFTQIVYTGENWGAGATARGARNEYHTTQSESRVSFTTLTDTVASAYYIIKRGEYQARFALDLGMPTGKPDYTTVELKSVITDPVNQDLMILNQYGAGWNIAPNLTLTRKFGKRLTAGIGLRYDYNGKFDISKEEDDELIDPGDRILALASGAYEVSQNDYLMLIAYYSRGSEDKRGSKVIFREGDSAVGEARYLRIWNETTKSTISFSYASQAKNEFVDSTGFLSAELHNTNNNWWELLAYTLYRRSDYLAITGIAGYKQVAANGYDAGHTLYDGGRSKYYLEPGVILIFRETFYTTLKFRATQVSDKKDGFSPKDSRYDVYNLDLAMVYNF